MNTKTAPTPKILTSLCQEQVRQKFHRLWGMRCYLAGSIDRAKDYGVGWRQMVTPFLRNFGVVVLNPCDKPIDIAFEIENKDYRSRLIREKNYDEFVREMKPVRVTDLRMVDISDFLIVSLDNTINSCGTYEEIFWQNRMKKPVLIWGVQGKDHVPDWLFSTIPHEHIFGSWEEIETYLTHVHRDIKVETYRRWVFFDYTKMVPTIKYEDS